MDVCECVYMYVCAHMCLYSCVMCTCLRTHLCGGQRTPFILLSRQSPPYFEISSLIVLELAE